MKKTIKTAKISEEFSRLWINSPESLKSNINKIPPPYTLVQLEHLLDNERALFPESDLKSLGGCFSVSDKEPKELRIDGMVLDCEGEYVRFRHFQSIRLFNCIILGDVIFSTTDRVDFNECFVLGEIKVHGKAGTSLVNTHCQHLYFNGKETEAMIYSSKINSFTAEGDFSLLRMHHSDFGKFYLDNVTIHNSDLKENTFSIDGLRKKTPGTGELNSLYYQQLVFFEHSKKQSHMDTINFLLASDSSFSNPNFYSELVYLRTLFRCNGNIQAGFTILTGAFVKPWLWMFYGALLLFLFSMGYWYSEGDRSFLECLYISGATFTTISYVDFFPKKGFSLFLTVLEGALGIIVFSSFLVSLANKYIDRK